MRIWRSTRLRVSGLGVGLLAVLLLANPHDAAAAAQPCERACLEGFVDQYLEAMLAHDPHRAPIENGVFTTNVPTPPLHSRDRRFVAIDPEHGMNSGWSSWEEGMSTEGRDASK